MRTITSGHREFLATLVAAAVFAVVGCQRSADEPAGRAATQATPAQGVTAEERERGEEDQRIGGREAESEEEKETEEEARMRQRVLNEVATFRAPTCRDAIAKIEELLRRGKGRWHERGEHGEIPADLIQLLTQAELWSGQSESVCRSDPAKPRVDALRSLMLMIWRYPRLASRETLDDRLRVLDE